MQANSWSAYIWPSDVQTLKGTCCKWDLVRCLQSLFASPVQELASERHGVGDLVEDEVADGWTWAAADRALVQLRKARGARHVAVLALDFKFKLLVDSD